MAAVSLLRPRIVAALFVLSLFWLVVVDHMVFVSLGPISVSGAMTIMGFLACLYLAPALIPRWVRAWDGLESPRLLILTPLIGFLIYSLARLVTNVSIEGVQNVCVYGTFILTIGLCMALANDRDVAFAERWFPRAATVATLAFVVAWAVKSDALFGARSFALSALVFLAIAVPLRKGAWRAVLPFVILFATAVSLSRTATIIGVVLLLFLSVRRKKFRKLTSLGMALVAGLVMTALITFYAPFRDRFLTGDNAVSVGGTSINTSGRTELWSVAWESAMQSPILGKGPGSCAQVIAQRFPTIGHPHNDYLRVFHDFGLIGVTLWVVGLLLLLGACLHRAHRLDRPIDWSASLALIATMLAAVTDNVIVYPFAMVPAAMLVGLSLAGDLSELALRVRACDKRPEARRIRENKDAGSVRRLKVGMP